MAVKVRQKFSPEISIGSWIPTITDRNVFMSLLTFSLLISEDLWLFLIFPAIAVFSAHLSEGAKTLRSLRKERKTQKSSLISKEKVNKGVRNTVDPMQRILDAAGNLPSNAFDKMPSIRCKKAQGGGSGIDIAAR